MKVLDLFSGIGGFSLGLERAGMETVAFCEIDPFCREVLKKHWPAVPIHEDIRELKGGQIAADIICGGFPCQPFSVAGKQRGEEDDRHLWPEMLRVIEEVRPRWVIGENVAGLSSMAKLDCLPDLESETYAGMEEGTVRDTEGPGHLEEILVSLEQIGYTILPVTIPACAVDAKHRRDRIWIVAHDEKQLNGTYNPEQNKRQVQQPGICSCKTDVSNADKQHDDSGRHGASKICRNGQTPSGLCRCKQNVSYAKHNGSCGEEGNETIKGGDRQNNGIFERGCAWAVEPAVGRVANGIPRRVDRLRSLGNAVVPQIPEMIGRAIMEIDLARG